MLVRRDRSWRIFLLVVGSWRHLSLAFVTPSQTISISSAAHHSIPQSPTLLFQSSNSGGDDDDEISKLIGKRSQIKRKRKDEEENPVVSEPSEPLRDLDLDKLPQFKTERPVRRQNSETKEKVEKSTDKKKKKGERQSDAPIIDFQAEYDDENDVHIPNRIGVTTIAWGNPKRKFIPSGKLAKKDVKAGKFVPGDLQLAFNDLLASGITFVETSHSYGGPSMKAHSILKQCLAERPEGIPDVQLIETYTGGALQKVLATLTLNMAVTTESALVNGQEGSLEELGDLPTTEIFQVPYSWYTSTSALSKGLAAVLESGQASAVGVVGVTSGRKLKKLCNQLADMDYSLTSNLFEFSLTNRKNEKMIAACKTLNVIPLISNPLDDGLASGVSTATNPTGGGRGGLSLSSAGKQYTFKQLEKVSPVHSVLETVAERARSRVIKNMNETKERFRGKYGPSPNINTDISTTQVALNYVIAKGGVPLPEVNNPQQAKEVIGCLGWSLDDEEVNMLDSAAALSSS